MTKLNEISPQFTKHLFKHWATSNFSEEEMDTLYPLVSRNTNIDQRRLEVRDFLYQLVVKKLPISQQDNDDHIILTETLKKKLAQKDESEEFLLIYCRYLGIQQHQIQELADISRLSPRTVRRYIQKGFQKISVALKLELNRTSSERKIAGYTPLMSADRVVGIAPLLQRVRSWFAEENPPRAISIQGLGGIGKTILAQHIFEESYQAKRHDEYVWVSARQESISFDANIHPSENFVSNLDDIVARLAQNLGQSHLAGLPTQEKINGLQKLSQKRKLLIVIDNLETTQDVENIIPALLQITSNALIIFTSRESLSSYPSVRILRVPELSFEDSYELTTNEISRLDLPLTVDKETIRGLYELTGGVPLALKLATAQFARIPASEIIKQLRKGEKNAYSMYTYIYRQAWSLLGDTGKMLLLSMLFVSPDGEDREWICEQSNLSTEFFNAGVNELKRLSLLELSGSVEKPRYRIHRLTTTFLHTDILKNWEDIPQ